MTRMTRRRSELSEEERRLFREAVADVTPIAAPERVPPAPPAMRRPAATQAPPPVVPEPGLEQPTESLVTADADEPVAEFRRAGLQHGVMRKLRSGRLPVVDELDLHGLHRGAARETLMAFLIQARREQQCCVRVIHGRGGRTGQPAVLRPLVRQWLREWGPVLAYCPAPRNRGGTGALHVLLAASPTADRMPRQK